VSVTSPYGIIPVFSSEYQGGFLKILILNYEFPPYGGGAGHAAYNLAQGLARAGHDVSVLTSSYNGQKRKEIINAVNIHRVICPRKGVHDCGLRGALFYVLFAAIELRRLCRKNKYDLLHYFFSLPTGLLSLIPGPHGKIPYVVSLRGSDVPYYDVCNAKVHIFGRILKPVTKVIWRNAGKVVALSKGLKQIALLTYPNLDIDIIGNGIEADVFKPLEQGKNCDRQGKLRFITVSRLIKRKGIENIFKALAGLTEPERNQLELMIVGSGSYEKHLRDLCRDLHISDVVSFYGYCPRDKLFELYNRADVFVLPSLSESFGMVFLEAMACGLPVIATSVGGIPELVENGVNGFLVPPDDVASIKTAIREISSNQDLREIMSLNNLRKVREYYSWDSVVRKYLDEYDAVCVGDNAQV
jgi:glycosyltransferase involved in cell wall biosynthesis